MFYLLHIWCFTFDENSTKLSIQFFQRWIYSIHAENGMFILWNHISDIFYEDRESGLHILPKLSNEHIKVTPYSKMNVRLAAQVHSSTVGNVLLAYGPPEAAETACFCSLMDCFIGIMNI